MEIVYGEQNASASYVFDQLNLFFLCYPISACVRTKNNCVRNKVI